MHSFFQKIMRKFSSDDKAVFGIVGLFFIIVSVRFIFGFVPWYFLGVAVPMFFIALVRPKAGLCAMIVLTVLFERFFTLEAFQMGRDAIKFYPIDAVLLGIYGNVLAQVFFRKAHITWKKPDIFFLLFFLSVSMYFALSFVGFGNQELSVSFSTWKNYVFYGLMLFAAPLLLKREEDVKRSVYYFLSVTAVAILFLMIGILRGEGLWTEYTPLSTGGARLLAFPHAFYFSLAFLGMIVSAKYWSRHANRYVIWMFVLVWAIGIVGSLMRHIWMGLALAGGLSFIFLMEREGRRIVKRMVFILIVWSMVLMTGGLFYSLLFPTNGISRSFQSLNQVIADRVTSIGNISDESISWRGSTWQSAGNALSRNPLFGSGFGMHVPVESENYQDFIEIRNIHNSWLALLVQMGILGASLLIASCMTLLWLLFRTVISSEFLSVLRNALIALVIYFAIVLMAQPYLETNLMNIFFWLVLGLLKAVFVLVEKEKRCSSGLVSKAVFPSETNL